LLELAEGGPYLPVGSVNNLQNFLPRIGRLNASHEGGSRPIY